MALPTFFRRGWLALALGTLLGGMAQAEEPCRIAFDIGSSGIRVGGNAGAGSAKASIDYLSDVWADQRIDVTVDATVAALKDMPAKAVLPAGCQQVAGGFSAWRLALDLGDRRELVETLAELHGRSGVAVFVIPQAVEGAYGYASARALLGDRLKTRYILDIGGGSLQIADAGSGWGTTLGQKTWHREFCQVVRGDSQGNCQVLPLTGAERRAAAHLLAGRIGEARRALPGRLDLTAISPPVTRSVYPLLRYLAAQGRLGSGRVDERGFDLAAVNGALDLLTGLDAAHWQQLLGECRAGVPESLCQPSFGEYVASDLLLVQALMNGLGVNKLKVAEADINNVPGLLGDDRAYRWSEQYSCYLARLDRRGADAYLDDPASCGR